MTSLYDVPGGCSKKSQRMVERLVNGMGVTDVGKSAFEGVVVPGEVSRLSIKNDLVLFADEETE